MFAIVSAQWPTRYYFARDLRKLGAKKCNGVTSLKGLGNIMREGIEIPCCAIVDQMLLNGDPRAIAQLRETLGEVPLVILCRNSAYASSEDPPDTTGFEFRLDAPAGAQMLRWMHRELCLFGEAETDAA